MSSFNLSVPAVEFLQEHKLDVSYVQELMFTEKPTALYVGKTGMHNFGITLDLEGASVSSIFSNETTVCFVVKGVKDACVLKQLPRLEGQTLLVPNFESRELVVCEGVDTGDCVKYNYLSHQTNCDLKEGGFDCDFINGLVRQNDLMAMYIGFSGYLEKVPDTIDHSEFKKGLGRDKDGVMNTICLPMKTSDDLARCGNLPADFVLLMPTGYGNTWKIQPNDMAA